jgi:hypothetical protein
LSDEYLSIDELAALLRRRQPVVFGRIRKHGVTTYRLPPDKRTYVHRRDVAVLSQSAPPGRPVVITTKRGGYRGG